MTPLYVFAGLFVYNVAVTLLTQAESRNRTLVATAIAGPLGVVSLGITAVVVTALQGHNGTQIALVYLAVLVGNSAGTYVGASVGKRWLRSAAIRKLSER